jgi:hypothetical protein
VRTAQQSNPSSAVTSVRGPRDCPTVVATEVLLLRPRADLESAAARESTVTWPLFVMVVTEPAEASGMSPWSLFGTLNLHEHVATPLVVPVEPTWTVLDADNALLALTVRAEEPVSVSLRIVLPAAPVLDILDMVARGAPVGVTTRDRAERLRGRFDVGAALRDVVLLSCPPSAELAELADALRATREAR